MPLLTGGMFVCLHDPTHRCYKTQMPLLSSPTGVCLLCDDKWFSHACCRVRRANHHIFDNEAKWRCEQLVADAGGLPLDKESTGATATVA